MRREEGLTSTSKPQTNLSNPQYDYTGGNLGVLLDIVIESGAKLFVSAVGIPPQWAIDKLHKAGVL